MIIAAVGLIIHSLIHFIGTAAYAQHDEIKGLTYKSTVRFGHWDLGRIGIRVYGWLWALPAIGFCLRGHSSPRRIVVVESAFGRGNPSFARAYSGRLEQCVPGRRC
jgi:hypothetical protein